jgi:aminopeptidase N
MIARDYRKYIFLLSKFVFILSANSAHAASPLEAAPCCLPKDVVPLSYKVHIVPPPDAMSPDQAGKTITFAGDAEILVDVRKPTNSISFNVLDLTFDKADVTIDGETAAGLSFVKDQSLAKVELSRELSPGQHRLVIRYKGLIVPQPHGIYYVDYGTRAGKRRMLVTQFEATDARRMFPSWDEPVFKAAVTLSVELPKGVRAVSNMPVASEEPTASGMNKITFAPTPKMSTYLAALIAGDIDFVEQKLGGIDVRVYAPSERKEQGRYALDAATRLVPFMNEYFGVNYPLPKLDLLAIPNFAAAAMENWGALTYIDNVLLFDPEDSTEGTRNRIYEVVAHELAHQWVGDLVTMAWWNDLWLNEGFATWMQKKATDHFNPLWKVWVRAQGEKEGAMGIDARVISRAIRRDIPNEALIDSAFDAITYTKGAAIIRMIEAYVGEENFREGMRLYMKDHAYGNAVTSDLWAAVNKTLETAQKKLPVPLADIAGDFTNNPGVPLISLDSRCEADQSVVTLKQDRFSIHNPNAEPRTWRVPVSIGRPGDVEPQSVVVEAASVELRFAGCGEPVKANIGDVGYFRVDYSPKAAKALIANFERFAPADRANLLSDAWAMVQAGRAGPDRSEADRIQPGRFLDFTRQLGGETDLAVWARVVDTLFQIDDLQSGAPGRYAFREYARGLLRPAFERLGWDAKTDELATSPLDVQLRGLLIRALGRFGDQDIIGEARRRFVAFQNDPKSLDKDLRDAVVTVVGYHADAATFDALRDLGRNAPSTEAKLRYYFALAGAQDTAFASEIVNIALTNELPSGRVDRFLGAAAGANPGSDALWQAVLRNKPALMQKLTTGQKERLFAGVARASSNPAIAFELKWKVEEATASEGGRYQVDKAVDEIEFKAGFKPGLLAGVDAWLSSTE